MYMIREIILLLRIHVTFLTTLVRRGDRYAVNDIMKINTEKAKLNSIV